MAAINITDISDGTIGGNGSFDKLMAATKAHLQAEFDASRIQGADYATVYLGSLQTVLQQAVAFELGKQSADKQADLLAQKIATEEAQTLDTTIAGSNPGAVTGVAGKQKALLAKQTDGFDRDAEQKTLKIMMDSYAIRRSSDAATVPPIQAQDTSIDAFILKAAGGINVVLPDTWTIGGTVTGLAIDAGLIIQNNGGDDLVIPAGATTFVFDTLMADNFDYLVTEFTNNGQTIVISNETGTVNGANITNVLITVS